MDSNKINGAKIRLFFTFSKYLIFFLKKTRQKVQQSLKMCEVIQFDAICRWQKWEWSGVF